jgi:hypothetical protein
MGVMHSDKKLPQRERFVARVDELVRALYQTSVATKSPRAGVNAASALWMSAGGWGLGEFGSCAYIASSPGAFGSFGLKPPGATE